MSQTVSKSTGRRPMDLTGTPAASLVNDVKPIRGCQFVVGWSALYIYFNSYTEPTAYFDLFFTFLSKIREIWSWMYVLNYWRNSTVFSFWTTVFIVGSQILRNFLSYLIYMVNFHSRFDHLKCKFEYGLRFLLGNNMAKLREKVIIKYRFGGRDSWLRRLWEHQQT